MMAVSEVSQYIENNVLHSKLYDTASPEVKQKAVNQAIHTLLKYMPDVYRDEDSLPVDEVAEQVLWLLKMDDSMQRAEMGAMMITVDGIQIQLRDMDRTISPKLLTLHGKTSIRRGRVGMYSEGTSYRVGHQLPPSYYRRGY